MSNSDAISKQASETFMSNSDAISKLASENFKSFTAIAVGAF